MTAQRTDRHLLIAFATLLAISASAHAQQAASPEAEAEARAVAVVEAIAGGDADAIWSALEEHLDPATLARRPEASWRQMIGVLARDLAGAEIRSVMIDDGEVRVGVAHADHPATFSFAIGVESPYRLGGFSAALGEPEPDAGGGPLLEPGMTRDAATAAIRDFVDTHAAEAGFSGTVLVARDGEVWHQSAHGLAHRGYGVANHPGTRFDLGSINKLFTKLAIAQLAAAGKLSLDDTLAARLPSYPNRETAARITVRQLADHASGLGDIFVPAFAQADKTRFRRPEDFFPLFADAPLLFEPGSGRQYSNAGYQVLGAIVAAASGMDYHDSIAERVWAPAGMTATAFVARDEPTADVAVGYTEGDDGRLRNNLFALPVIGSPAGSSFSTSGDMLRFDRALRSGKLVAAAWAAWVLTGEEPGEAAAPPALDRLGLGFAGGAPGVNAMYEIAGAWTVIVLANQDPPAAGRLAQALANALRRFDG